MPRSLVILLLGLFNSLVFALAWHSAPTVSVVAQPQPSETAVTLTDPANFTNTTFLLPQHLPAGAGHGQATNPDDQLSTAERVHIQQQLDQSLFALSSRLPALLTSPVTFTWPLRNAPLLADYNNHGISNFVDQNPNFPNQVQDYACGTRSYDTADGYNHAGTDIFTWPFGWYKMDHDQVQVIAAAPGTILYKSDGNNDRSCSFNGNNWNAVYIRHADGSVAWYGHLKRGSLTAKPVGSAIARGEYVGIVGSSGNSTGPHLHFEVHTVDNELIDPFAGACNTLNADSWWQDQPDYYDSGVNAVATGFGSPVFPACPLPEDGRQTDDFTAGDRIYFTTYYRDQLNTQTSLYTIYQPDGAIYQSWTHSINPAHYAASYWYWYFTFPTDVPSGTWRFEVNYWGKSYETYFNVSAPTYLTLTAPLTGSIWTIGQPYTATWQDNLGGPVQVGLFQQGELIQFLGLFTDSQTSLTWTVPLSVPLGGDYQLRAINATNATLSDTVNLGIWGTLQTYIPVARRAGPKDGGR